MSHSEIIKLNTAAKYIRPNGNIVECKVNGTQFYYAFNNNVFTNLTAALLTADLNKNYLLI